MLSKSVKWKIHACVPFIFPVYQILWKQNNHWTYRNKNNSSFHSILHSYTLMTMAETFVNCGYSVIYLHKVFTSNKYSKVSNCWPNLPCSGHSSWFHRSNSSFHSIPEILVNCGCSMVCVHKAFKSKQEPSITCLPTLRSSIMFWWQLQSVPW